MTHRLSSRTWTTSAFAAGCAGLLALSACASRPAEGSLTRMKQDQVQKLYYDCSRHPDAYGYPYSLAEYMRLPLEVNAQLVDPNLHCHRVVRRMVR
jgi:hypothetical protein